MKSGSTAAETLDGKPAVTDGTARRRQVRIAATGTTPGHERAKDFRAAGEVSRPLDAANLHMRRHFCGVALANRGSVLQLIEDYPGHRDSQHMVRYTRTAGSRFEGLWNR